MRRPVAAVAAVVLLVCTFLAGSASAATPNATDCRKVAGIPAAASPGSVSSGQAFKYDECRFDALEALIRDGGPATPDPTPTASASPTPSASPSVSPSATPSPTAMPTPTPTASPTSSAALCTNPTITFTGQGSRGVPGPDPRKIGGNGYDISAEQWGVSGYNYQSTLRFCSLDSWNVDITTDNAKGDGAVKSYPSIRRIYHDWSSNDFSKDPRLSSFPQLRVDFASVDPASCSGCIYDTAFDIWLNGIGGANNTELMIWTHNVGQRPYGSKVASGIEIGGHTWDLWSGNSDHYIAFVPTDVASIPSGTVDVKAFVAELKSRNRIASTSLPNGQTDPFVGQISFGVEPVSTGGVSRRWDFTRFNITDS